MRTSTHSRRCRCFSACAQRSAPSQPPAPGAVVLRSDVERKLMLGVAETEPLPKDAYAAEITARVYADLVEKARRVTASGHSAIVDAVFAKPQERASIAAMAANRIKFHGLFLTADLRTRVTRIGGRIHDASDADAAVARQQETLALGTMDWSEVDASGTPRQTLERAKKSLS